MRATRCLSAWSLLSKSQKVSLSESVPAQFSQFTCGKKGVAESVYETVSEDLGTLPQIRRNHSVIQQRRKKLQETGKRPPSTESPPQQRQACKGGLSVKHSF
ncbi:MAG: hypothetical protein Fur0046_09410 [Cyanobacteria bacterium J069]